MLKQAPSERGLREAVEESARFYYYHSRYDEIFSIISQAPSVIFLRKCHLPPGGRPNKFARLRVDGNKCMAGRPILDALVRCLYY